MTVILYSSQLEILVGGQRIPLRHYWPTDSRKSRSRTLNKPGLRDF
jgi:hypothetical protein